MKLTAIMILASLAVKNSIFYLSYPIAVGFSQLNKPEIGTGFPC
jgi:hypothetical protein